MMAAGLAATEQGTSQVLATLAGQLRLPSAVAYDGKGNLYVAETNGQVIRRIDAAGLVTTVAGSGTQGFSGDGGPATAAALDSPQGIAVDAAGDLYIADTHNQRIRRVDAATGLIATFAGSAGSGLGGDGGPAASAQLDLPTALALDGAGNLYLADSNNHRIRRVAAGTGTITTVAGDGVQGFRGDGGAATAASIDTPAGLAVDGAGNLYLADTHNHRVRVVSAATGQITSLAGTGGAAFRGDNGTGTAGGLALPHGISVDAAGNVYVADTNNQRIRRIAADGTITTVVGNGTQVYSGDGGPGVAAGLDTPHAVTVQQGGTVTLADTDNRRIRQLTPLSGSLMLGLPTNVLYGTGSMTATLAAASPGTGQVGFFENTGAGPQPLGSVALAGGMATLSAAGLPAGTHQIYASYAGDATHAVAQSAVGILTVSPAPVTAAVGTVGILYGQAVPLLAGTLLGVLPRDQGTVGLTLSSAAATLSPAGVYAITGMLTGVASADYVLAPIAAAVTIARAPATIVMTAPAASAGAGLPVSLTVSVRSTTSGVPTGSVSLLDGGSLFAAGTLSGSGSAVFTTSAFAPGQHRLTASYAGDTNFLAGTTPATILDVPPVVPGDFAVATSGPASVTIPSGGIASFNFAVQMQGSSLSSPISLEASGLPAGTTASFTPSSLPPGGTVSAFILTVQTQKKLASIRRLRSVGTIAIAALVWMLPFGVRRLGLLMSTVVLAAVLLTATGCGSGVNSKGALIASASYPIMVSAKAMSPSGTMLVHTVTVTLGVE